MMLLAAPGTYAMGPVMTRSLQKLENLIENELNDVGCHKITLPCLASGDLWKSSGRWSEMGDELLRFKDRQGINHCLAPTHEEAITSYVKEFLIDRHDLPLKLFQIGRKFRDEMRPKHGLMRCREFVMKDLYGFDADEQSALLTYDVITKAYERIFARLELEVVRVAANSGAMGGSLSHEFHLLSSIGEDVVMTCKSCGAHFNAELIADDNRPQCSAGGSCEFENLEAIEIAHSFVLGKRYSQAFNACYKSDEGKTPYFMSCYGIGVTRLLQAALEVLSSEESLRWPRVIAPYQVFVVPQLRKREETVAMQRANSLCSTVHNMFSHLRHDIVLDDRAHLSIGARVRQASQLGIPHIVVVTHREGKEKLEYIDVYKNNTTVVSEHELMGLLASISTTHDFRPIEDKSTKKSSACCQKVEVL